MQRIRIIDPAGFSAAGPYAHNQDRFGCGQAADVFFACIADGVGGASDGERAADLAVSLFLSSLNSNPSADLMSIALEINESLCAESENSGLQTTFSGCRIDGRSLEYVHCGDTRICVLRGHGIKQITTDHTEVANLIEKGKLSASDAKDYPRKHVLESALGFDESPRIDIGIFELEPGDRILLTTDGVHKIVSKRDMRDLSLTSSTPDQLVDQITNQILSAPPDDNFTMIAFDFSTDGHEDPLPSSLT